MSSMDRIFFIERMFFTLPAVDIYGKRLKL